MTPREQPERAAASDDRFEAGAHAYADYLRTTEGRLRLDIAWENFRSTRAGANGEAHSLRSVRGDSASADAASAAPNNSAASSVSPAETRKAKGFALDLGCGTGALSVRLARAGWSVCAADSSATMIEIARESARSERCEDRIEFFQLEAARAAEQFGPRKFSVIVCHNVLEYVPDPAAVARAVGRMLAPGGVASLLARNRAGESLRDAIKLHDLDSAERALTAESVRESLYGGPARLFDAESLTELAAAADLETIAVRGVRVVADYLPPSLSETDDGYARLLDFELRLGARPDFAGIARYVQLFARAPGR